MSAMDTVSAKEAAELLGVSVPTVTRWAVTGRLRTALKLQGRTGPRLFDRTYIEGVAAGLEAAKRNKRAS